jgi:hypothetical protein
LRFCTNPAKAVLSHHIALPFAFQFSRTEVSEFMIDENCAIWKQGKGFCWCPSSAWGVTDSELCELCQIKNAQIIEKIGIINTQKLKTLSAQGTSRIERHV